MKALRLLALIAACMVCLYASSQDMIVTNEGTALKVYNLEVSSNSVFYQLEDKSDAPIQKMMKSDILIIKKADGTKLDFSAPTQPTAPAATPAASQSGVTKVTVENLSAEAKAANEALIAKYNDPVEITVDEKYKKLLGKKTSLYIHPIYGFKNNSVLSDENVEINFILGELLQEENKPSIWEEYTKDYVSPISPAVVLNLRNKTNSTIYVDLGNTFYITMGNAICYYVPSSTTTTQASSNGRGLNLGAVTGALGIGGVAGKLANGVTVGGSSTNVTSTVTFSQRVIAIPPFSSVKLPAQNMFGTDPGIVTNGLYLDESYYGFYLHIKFAEDPEKGKFKVGDRISFSEENSPLQMSYVVSYSFTEECSSLNTIISHMYLRGCIGNDDRRHVKILPNHILYGSFSTSMGTWSHKITNIGEFPGY